MRTKWHVVAAVLMMAGLIACAPAPSEEATSLPPLPGDTLIVRAAGGLTSLSVSGDGPVVHGAALAGFDHGSVMGVTETPDGAVLTRSHLVTGTALGELAVPGQLDPVVASETRDLVALATPRKPGATPWLPDGRRRSTVAVADLTSSDLHTFELEGNFEPEAFSTSGKELFMIEYIPGMDPDRYRVRRLRLNNGRILPIGRNKLAAPEQMRGTGRMQVMDPSGEALYTLYTRQGPNYAHGAGREHEDARGVHAFVHLLNLEGSWAHCIDLPEPFGTGSATASAITMSVSGGPLYVTDWSNGAVAVVSPDRLKVRTVKSVELGAPDDHTFAQVSPMNGLLYAAGNDQIAVLSTGELEVKDRWQFDSEVTGLRLSPDGERLYVGQRDAVLILDAVTGEETGRLPAPGLTALEGVTHPTD